MKLLTVDIQIQNNEKAIARLIAERDDLTAEIRKLVKETQRLKNEND